MEIRQLTTTSQVIDTLFGDQPSPNKAFARLISTRKIKRRDPHVSNYRSTGRFPPDTYLICQAELEKMNCSAPASLWGITEPKAMRRAG